MSGWIKLYDKMLDWEWYGNTNVVRVFLHCLLKANYQQRVWQGVTIERGQFITSVASMSAELGLSPKQVRGALMKLERANNLAIKGTNKYSVITICNYDIYQSSPDTKGQTKGRTTGKPKGEQQGNSNRYIDNTEEQNKNTTPNGDSKKKKFRKPSIEEIRDYILEYGCYWVDAERFFDYYESNGWKVGRNAMKDWKATIRTWANKDKKVNGEGRSGVPAPFQNIHTGNVEERDRDVPLLEGNIFGVDYAYIKRLRDEQERKGKLKPKEYTI